VYQSRFSALGSAHVRSGTVIHLIHGLVGRIRIRRVRINIAGVVLRGRGHVRGRRPANVGHVRASTIAAGRTLAVIQVGLQSRRRTIASGMRGRSHHIVTAR
jgi:hypothetical protein